MALLLISTSEGVAKTVTPQDAAIILSATTILTEEQSADVVSDILDDLYSTWMIQNLRGSTTTLKVSQPLGSVL